MKYILTFLMIGFISFTLDAEDTSASVVQNNAQNQAAASIDSQIDELVSVKTCAELHQNPFGQKLYIGPSDVTDSVKKKCSVYARDANFSMITSVAPRPNPEQFQKYIPKSNDTFYILSIDGGGIRGILPATILKGIEEAVGKPMHELFDMVVGTSTGGLISLYLGLGKRASEALDLYFQLGTSVFSRTLLRKVRSGGGLLASKYSAKPLEAILQRELGEARLSDMKIPSVFTSYDLKTRSMFLMNTMEAKTNSTFNMKLWEVARATTAAPIYFKPFEYRLKVNNQALDSIILTDGGLLANTPGLLGYLQAVKHFNPPKVVVISLGTGQTTGQNSISAKGTFTGGVLGMLGITIKTLFDAQSQLTSSTLKSLIKLGGGDYYRIAPTISEERSQMDDVSQVNYDYLETIGKDALNTPNVKDVINLLIDRAKQLDANYSPPPPSRSPPPVPENRSAQAQSQRMSQQSVPDSLDRQVTIGQGRISPQGIRGDEGVLPEAQNPLGVLSRSPRKPLPPVRPRMDGSDPRVQSTQSTRTVSQQAINMGPPPRPTPKVVSRGPLPQPTGQRLAPRRGGNMSGNMHAQQQPQQVLRNQQQAQQQVQPSQARPLPQRPQQPLQPQAAFQQPGNEMMGNLSPNANSQRSSQNFFVRRTQ